MKRKGFTLVEILAVITIIGILALITIPTIDSIIRSSKKDAYEVQKSAILMGLKNWAASKTLTLPEVNGETLNTTIGDLKKEGFLEVETRNPMNDLCFSNATVLVVTRNNSNYTYTFADEDNIEFTEVCEVE
jgi:prepilin-type N-terminal cleavage/methylation domain-containing protein